MACIGKRIIFLGMMDTGHPMASSRQSFDRLSIRASELNRPAAARLFQTMGVLHVRAVISAPDLTAVRDDILTLLDALSGKVGERLPYITFCRSLEYEIPMREAYKALMDLLGRTIAPSFNYLPSIARLAGCSRVSATHGYAREASPNGGVSAHVPYHQDYPTFVLASDIGAEQGFKRMMTCWIPLDPIDDQTPSIEYVPGKLDQELPFKVDGLVNMDIVGPALEARESWVPPVQLGDMVLHDQFTLHRSHLTPDMTKPRRNIELRFVLN